MSSFTMDTASDVSSSSMVEVAGKYHAILENVEINPMLGSNPFRGFRAEFTIAAGTAESEVEKTVKLLFGNPDANHKDKGEFARKKQTAFLIATGLLAPADMGKRVDVDFSNANGAQVCIEIEMQADRNDASKYYPELRYANIFHFSDPRAKAYPKDAESLKIAADSAKPESYFEPLKAKKKTETKQVSNDDLAGL